MRKQFLIVLALVTLWTGISFSATTIRSDFDANIDGWSGWGNGHLQWHPIGGNPGGFVYFYDTEAMTGGGVAPAGFLGDLTAFRGGSLKFDLWHKSDNGGGTLGTFGNVEITGAGTTLSRDIVATLPASWTSYSIPLTASEWGTDIATWNAVLADVTKIRIDLDAQGDFYDEGALDNFAIETPNILNGDFETAVPTDGTGGGWTSYNGIDGWFATGGHPGGFFVLNAFGNFVTDPTIEQLVTGLTPGATYRLTGDYAIYTTGWTCYTNPNGKLGIDIDGTNLAKIGSPTCNPNSMTWYSFSEDFVASSDNVTVAFRAEIDGKDTDYAIDTISLAYVGVVSPDITVTDSLGSGSDLQMPFPDTTEGVTSSAETVTLANTGNAALNVSAIQLSGVNPAEFVLDVNGGANPCGSTTPTVAAGDNCTVTVAFAPASVGAKGATLEIASNDPDEATVDVSLTGTGLSSVTNNPPGKPTLVFPANGQAGLSSTVTFLWRPVTDPDGDPVTYDLHYCTDPDPIANCTPVQVASLRNRRNAVAYAGTTSSAGVLTLGSLLTLLVLSIPALRRKVLLLAVAVLLAGSLTVSCGDTDRQNLVSYTASGLSSGTTYHWAVVAKDDQGGSTASDTWQFLTQ